MDQPREDILKNVLHSASLYFYSHPLQGFYAIYIDHIDASFVFLPQKDLYIAHESIVAFFVFFFFRKLFIAFTCFFMELFLVFL